ncbi:CLIP domain-containing serine protease HP8-like isoform X2 [Plodia interpunctella]|uniref:CLIP domain-containing serine protease HP8-like isoform X2 n=1 Tax=Plodia interpunctella TaxID=58824 RepID=UPI002367A80E|nr:CLIP domain-containing serine protease HP8-like isoform X2 [Plodia interpunctella]
MDASIIKYITVWMVVSLSGIYAQRCQGGADCIVLQDCVGLYNQLQQGASNQLTQLLRTLHCGFDANTPKICCPPEFSGASNGATNSVPETSNLESRVRQPSSLLPGYDTCGIQNDDRIVGGTRADIDEHPWMALLRYDKPKGWGFYCGGVLISQRYVMTAAHCVKGDDLPPNWRLSQVRLGEWNTSSSEDCVGDDCSGPVQDIPIEKVIAHEGYNPSDTNQHNDIALLRLSRNVRYNDFVKPICLPTDSALKRNSFVGFDMEVAGWGKTESQEPVRSKGNRKDLEESGSESEVKLKVRVPVVSNNECSDVYSRVSRRISNNQLCAGGVSGEDSCRGDSGGALMGKVPSVNNWVAVGVVSYGPSPCGTPGWPGVYTRVGAYVDWITSKVRP